MEKLEKTVDMNIQQMINLSVLELVKLGLKYGIFKAVSKKISYIDLLNQVDVPNKPLLKKLIDHLKLLGIIEETPTHLLLNSFSYEIRFPKEEHMYLLPDWIPSFEEIYRMVDFALITPNHPHVLMDFDKDADFWDLRLSSTFHEAYRILIAKLGEIGEGSRVLDIGCGSASPAYFGKLVGEEGEYVGVDYSPALLEIAKNRTEGLPVKLKEMDASLIKPKNKYDVAIMSFVLEYIENRRSALRNALDSLESGGKLIIVDAFKDEFRNVEALEFFEGLNSAFREYPSKKYIKEVILDEGFEVKFGDYGKGILLIEKL